MSRVRVRSASPSLSAPRTSRRSRCAATMNGTGRDGAAGPPEGEPDGSSAPDSPAAAKRPAEPALRARGVRSRTEYPACADGPGHLVVAVPRPHAQCARCPASRPPARHGPPPAPARRARWRRRSWRSPSRRPGTATGTAAVCSSGVRTAAPAWSRGETLELFFDMLEAVGEQAGDMVVVQTVVGRLARPCGSGPAAAGGGHAASALTADWLIPRPPRYRRRRVPAGQGVDDAEAAGIAQGPEGLGEQYHRVRRLDLRRTLPDPGQVGDLISQRSSASRRAVWSWQRSWSSKSYEQSVHMIQEPARAGKESGVAPDRYACHSGAHPMVCRWECSWWHDMGERTCCSG